MGRAPCCEKVGLKRGRWTAEEDERLMKYIQHNGEGSWRSLPKNAGLLRCGKSCRLRWLNYLRKDLKRGNISADEENLIIKLHNTLGNRWSLIAGHLPGRTDNEIKNYWNSHLSRRIESFIRRPSSSNSQSLPIIMDIAKLNGDQKQKGGRTSRATSTKKKNKPNILKSTRDRKASAEKENALAYMANQEKNMVMSNNNLVMSSSIIPPMQQNIEGEEEMTSAIMNMDPLSSERESVVLCRSEEDRERKEEVILVLGPIDEAAAADMMIMSFPSSNDANGNIIFENGVTSSNGLLSCTDYTDENGFMGFNDERESGVNTNIKTTTTSGDDQVSLSTCNGGSSSSQNENGEWYFTNSTTITSSSSSNNMTHSSLEDELGVCDWDNWVGGILESNNLLWEEFVGDDMMLNCWLGGENQW
ncbi:hypothetical protein MKW98_028576 [Papaver atlanticum]|uniref:Uncharacterized protein n=1 Tax=Papaver atlanticum TaxID=357466 RepID=A0AAD4TDA4_9MAGN|nr:hypothetical protein MKW98_028576 [Papaver atlanticum]